jgi:HD-like signal output (HDOD) protein
MINVLFVDDEPNVLDGLRRMLRSVRDEVEAEFASSGNEALAILDGRKFDVIVTDMRMPGMDGAELLNHVTVLFPHVVRIVLSGQCDQESVLRTVGSAHQFLYKPCSADTLLATIERARSLSRLLSSERLRALAMRIGALPSLPSVYVDLTRELRAEEPSIQRIGNLIATDVAMSAKILHMVNSAFFGLPREVGNTTQAAAMLGTETIRALVLSVHVFGNADDDRIPGLSLSGLMTHSAAVAVLAKRIAQVESGDRAISDCAFLAGFLHDVGHMVLASHLGCRYADARQLAESAGMPTWLAERSMLGGSHAEVGAYLLGLWSLPSHVVESVAFHHRPSECPGHTAFSALGAVHIAEVLERERDGTGQDQHLELDDTYINALGLGSRVTAWRDIRDELDDRRTAA